jgi:hypothetical protein
MFPLPARPVTTVSCTDDPNSPVPSAELTCRYDDPADPAELTIFPPEVRSCATEWLTVDCSTAVRLDRIR